MRNYSFKSHKAIVLSFMLTIFSYLCATFYFKVTNSNIFDIVPEGQIQLSFESDEFDNVNFELSGDNNWSLTTEDSYTGIYSIQSGSISNNETSTISLELNIIETGQIEFYYKVDSEYSTSGNEFYDGLYFYINDELIDQFQTDTDGVARWNYFSYNIDQQGPIVISWSYIKDAGDGSTQSINDHAWIDDISFPVSAPLFYDYYQQPPPQDHTSGLFSAFVHPQNNESNLMKAKGGILIDFDLDNDLDLYYGYTSCHYFQNINGTFQKISSVQNTGIRGLVAGDIDNNGYPDILKWRYSSGLPHYLLLNLGNHDFEEVTYLNSIEMNNLHSQGLIDVDLDGDLDIIAIESEGSEQFYCFLNNSTSDEIKFDLGYSFSRQDNNSSSRTLAIADFDNDGDQDVFIPRKEGKNWLFVNQTLTLKNNEYIYNHNRNQLFIEQSEEYGIDDQAASKSGSTGYGGAWADFDNDNHLDLYLTNWGENRLFKNNKDLLENIAENTTLESDSLSNGAGWGDFNNDGYIDIWSNNFKRGDDLLINPGENTNKNWNLYDTGFLSATQDVIPADYNNDGWLDMFTPGLLIAFNNSVEDIPGYKYTSLLYNNVMVDSLQSINNWLKLDLEGSKNNITNNGWTTQSNHSAIGARVITHLPNMNLSREIIAGKGHGSMDPLQLHFGLGQNTTIDGITIYWPSKDIKSNSPKISYFDGPINVNQSLRIVEDIGFVGFKGDVTNDDNVNIFDILEVVNIILYEPSLKPVELWSVDMDYSNYINVIDITMLVNFILLP